MLMASVGTVSDIHAVEASNSNRKLASHAKANQDILPSFRYYGRNVQGQICIQNTHALRYR